MFIKDTRWIYQQSYLTVPRSLFCDSSLSPAARLLYIHLLDRSKLSEQNGFVDDKGIFVFCTREEAARLLGCGLSKVQRCFKELVQGGYLFCVRQGQCRANKYYVHKPPQSDSGLEAEENGEPNAPSLPTGQPIGNVVEVVAGEAVAGGDTPVVNEELKTRLKLLKERWKELNWPEKLPNIPSEWLNDEGIP